MACYSRSLYGIYIGVRGLYLAKFCFKNTRQVSINTIYLRIIVAFLSINTDVVW